MLSDLYSTLSAKATSTVSHIEVENDPAPAADPAETTNEEEADEDEGEDAVTEDAEDDESDEDNEETEEEGMQDYT